ncbi:MAG: L,D-transpeptidase [Polyangiaceae bacterium]
MPSPRAHTPAPRAAAPEAPPRAPEPAPEELADVQDLPPPRPSRRAGPGRLARFVRQLPWAKIGISVVSLAIVGGVVLAALRMREARLAEISPSAGAGSGSAAAGAVEPPKVTQGQSSVPVAQPKNEPMLGIRAFVTPVYSEPRDTSKKLGYLRVGALVARSAEPAGKAGCPGGWYQVHPRGYVCAGEDATTDLDDPLLKAGARRPDLRAAMPYRYAFVRAVLPMYLRVPTADEQFKSEFKLQEHLDWYKENKETVSKPTLGAFDVPIDERGVALSGKKLGELGMGKNSLELGLGQLLGGETDDDPVPFWLEAGKRLIPNVSDYKTKGFEIFADRARRHTGLALIGSFQSGEGSLYRRFGVTTDLRLAPASKIKPDTGSPWHGVELSDSLSLPLAFVRAQGARIYKVSKGKAERAGEADYRSIHQLTGRMRTVEGVKYYRSKDGYWLHQQDVGLAIAPASWPKDAEEGKKWIEVSISSQTLVLWEGKQPVYATLVSTGKAGLADPKTTTATVRGVFKIRNKHVSATMDSYESSSVGGKAATSYASKSDSGDDDKPARSGSKPKSGSDKGSSDKGAKGGKGSKASGSPDKKAGAKPKSGSKEPKPGDPDYVPRKGDGLYGVTLRRGHGTYQLRDVPYIQYFESGYALHVAYWHDVFGTPRSHGCINLSPVDGHRVFLWTEPAVPEGWHAINTGEDMGEGTTVIVHE